MDKIIVSILERLIHYNHLRMYVVEGMVVNANSSLDRATMTARQGVGTARISSGNIERLSG